MNGFIDLSDPLRILVLAESWFLIYEADEADVEFGGGMTPEELGRKWG